MLHREIDAQFFAYFPVNRRVKRFVVRLYRAAEDRPATGIQNPRRMVALLQQHFTACVDRKYRHHMLLRNHLPSSALITVSRSLSPRPDRFLSSSGSLGM